VGLVVAGLGVVASAPTASAAPGADRCTCPGGKRIDRLAKQADAVFTARVVTSSSRTHGEGKKAKQVRLYTAEVDRVFQGKVTRARVLIRSAQSTACGFGNIPTDQTWLFFVTGGGARFIGNVCGGAGRATDAKMAKVEAELGQGTTMQPTQPPREPLAFTDEHPPAVTPLSRLIAPGAAVTLIGLLGLVLFRRRA